MDITWEIAILGAVVTVLGWWITHFLSTSAKRRRQRLNFQLDYIKQQLEELYGPLAFLVWEGKQTFADLFAAVGWTELPPRDHVLSEAERAAWFFWAEHDFFPRNQRIKELLSAHTDLIDGGTMPASFLAFLDHYNSWHINYLRLQAQGIDFGWRSKIPWPEEFERTVIDTFQRLKKQHAHLIGVISARRS